MKRFLRNLLILWRIDLWEWMGAIEERIHEMEGHVHEYEYEIQIEEDESD